eukprot:CAMPEP_0174967150 /NCGR_PEP_ID=MMETSP0004_2-20121128/7425_1 /TAXON_ID=420556 /ORGANISM="Ochromonas sp., Strain CCMP1393" /LENGTH=160 /DNA_ID=CAMNT_0016216253 /DNA_START=96 /DNA_END=578 /DNA_ORIENTATION=+
MFSTKIAVLALILVTLASVSAFKRFAATHSRKSVALNAFGVKKLGQSIIDTLVTPSTDSISHIDKQRPQTGAGTDDRLPIECGEEEEDSYEVLSTINRSFEQKTLLMGLESSSWGMPEKMERIRLASSVDGTLPVSTNFTPQTVAASNLKAGGLMDDWEF